MNKHTCHASADSVLSASWPDMSGGTDRVFCVARSLFYSLFFPQDTFRTVLAPPVCMRLSQFLNANPRDIQLYWVVKDVGVTMGSSICPSSTRTKQRGNSESVRSTRADESIERFLNCLKICIGVPRWCGARFSYMSRPTVFVVIVSIDGAINETAVQGDKYSHLLTCVSVHVVRSGSSHISDFSPCDQTLYPVRV